MTLPASPSRAYRAGVPADLPALQALVRLCLDHDGSPLAAMWADTLVREPGPVTAGWCACAGPVAQIVAYAQVALEDGDPAEPRAVLAVWVHPQHRGSALDEALLSWAEVQAGCMLRTLSAPRPAVLQVRDEALTPAAAALYARHGFTLAFGEDAMRHDLAALSRAGLPAGLRLLPWTAETIPRFYAAYSAAFADRPGFPGWSAEQWVSWISGSDEFRPELSLVALPGDDLAAAGDRFAVAAGFIACELERRPSGELRGWVEQMGVRPAWRRRGLAAALLDEALRRFRAAGAHDVLLHVNVDNPAARHLYERLGFVVLSRRARYTRSVR